MLLPFLPAQLGGGAGPGSNAAPSLLPEAEAENYTDWVLWLARMLKAIKRNRVDDVRTLLKSGAACRWAAQLPRALLVAQAAALLRMAWHVRRDDRGGLGPSCPSPLSTRCLDAAATPQ